MSGNKMMVLIVEDNPGDAFLIEGMLKDLDLNLNVMVIEDGKQAVSVMMEGRERTPDLIILDLNLPRMNGFDVLAFMKAESSLGSIPVIVMTGSLRKEDEVRARSLGAADYCIKPATFIEIERARGCLKAQLEIINCNKREKRGPSTGSGPNLFMFDDRRVPPSCNERFIMDALDENLNMWN